MHVIQDLLNLVKNGDDLLGPFENIHPHIRELMIECKTVAIERKVVSKHNLQQVEYVLVYLHDHLNIGKWDEVEEYLKQAYTCASYVKMLIVLQLNSTFNVEKNVEIAKKSLQFVDKGFLLGLPLANNNSLLTNCASLLTKYVNLHEGAQSGENFERNTKVINQTVHLPNLQNKKLKVAHFESDKAHQIDIKSCPSLELFQKEYFSTEKPLVIQDCLTTWPARTKWLDINYLLDIGGERTVPIELGSSYSSEDFSQKLMTLREFINTYYSAEDGGEIGYLAQHDLLTQIPELIDDIKIPDYCCLSRTAYHTQRPTHNHHHNDEDEGNVEPEINAWLGPRGTVSSLHYDPKDNLLCQVYGAKQIIMFAPSDTQYLYAHDDMPMLSNTSQVDPTNPDLTSFADFNKATMYVCLLHAGEMLYIPPKWWHHVTALEKSFSVNFWWQ